MAKTTEEQRLKLLQEYKKITGELAELEKERLKQEGVFLTKKREELIELEKAAAIQKDFVKAAERQAEINELINEKARISAQLQATNSQNTQQQNDALQRQLTVIDSQLARAQQNLDKFNVATIKAATKGIQDASKRAQIEADILQIQNDIAAGNILPEDAEEKLQLLTKAVEDLVEMEKRLKNIEKISKDAFGNIANFFGMSNEFSDKINELIGAFKGLPFDEVMGRMGTAFRETFNLTNLIGSVLKGLFEQAVSVMNTQADIAKATGLSKEFTGSFLEAKKVTDDLGLSGTILRDDILAAGQAFAENLPIFTALPKQARTELIAMGAQLTEVGADLDDMSTAIMDLMAITGDGAVGAAQQVMAMNEEFVKFGITPKEAMSNLSQMAPQFAVLGRAGIKSFVELTKKAKALNVEIGEIVKIGDLFDTFESAIPTVMNLNAIVGKLTGSFGSYFDAQALVMEQDVDKRFEMLREGFDQAGVSVQALAEGTTAQRQSLKALAETMGGMEIDEFIKAFEKSNSTQLKAVDINQKLTDSIKDATNFSDMMAGVFQFLMDSILEEFGMTIQDVAHAIKDFIIGVVLFVKENAGLIKTFMIVIPLLGTIANLVTILGPMFAGMGAAAAAGTAAAGGGFMAMLAPIGLVIGAIALIITFAEEIGETIKVLADAAYYAVTKIVDAILYPIERVLGILGDVAGGIKSFFGFGDDNAIGINQRQESATFAENMVSMKMMASGGTVGRRGQVALVGEKGPEIVALPPDSAVLSNADSNKIASGIQGYADGTTTLKNIVNQVNTGRAGGGSSGMASEIVNGLKPMLKEIADATIQVAKNAGGDVYFDGKKVGKVLEPQMVRATERKMQKVLLGKA